VGVVYSILEDHVGVASVNCIKEHYHCCVTVCYPFFFSYSAKLSALVTKLELMHIKTGVYFENCA
jgi:hypothetical protein